MFTIITQLRNEEKRIKDWIKYHHKLGVLEFVIFCDNCTDGTEKVLESLKNEYNIKIFQANKFGTYNNSTNPNDYKFTSVCQRIRDSYKRGLYYIKENNIDINHWSIFIEVDEYIVPQTELGLKEIINNIPMDLHRIYMSSYDFKCPFDLDTPVYEQTYYRWSDETRKNGIVNNVRGWFKNRGKSMVRTVDTNTDSVDIHDVDFSKYYQNDEILKINHYRNFGELPIYDFYDDKIKNYI